MKIRVLKTLGLLLLIVVLNNISVYAQEDSTQASTDSLAAADSAQNQLLVSNTKYLQHLDSIKTADSLKRAQLESELASLKTTDNLKKQELLDELQKIKDDENKRFAEQKSRIDSLKKVVKGFPVSPFEDTICYLYTKLGPFSPKMRATNIEHRIREMEDKFAYHPDSIKVIASEESVDLLFEEDILLSITDKDALWMGMSREELAEKYKAGVVASIKGHRKATSLQTLLIEIGQALLVIIILILAIKYLNKGHRWLKLKVHESKGTKINGIKIRNYELFTADSEVRAIYTVTNIIRWIVILVLLYIAIPTVLRIFPWTKNLAGTLFGYILNPLKSILLGIWNYMPNLMTILVIGFVFRYVFRGLSFLKDEIKNGRLHIPGFYPDWANPTYQIIKILLIAFMIIVIFPYLPGSDSEVFRGVSVFLGVLFTFGSTGALSNVIAGLVLTYMRAYKIGDRVKIGAVSGDIIQKTLLITRIRTIKNEDITIPNSTIMASHTINYSSAATKLGLIVHTTVTIGYDVPWKKVHELLKSAAMACEFISEEPEPFVLQTSLDDFYVSYQLNAYTKEPAKQAIIYSLIHQNIQDKFNEAGVEIMSPHYGAHRDGNQTTIPADNLPADYEAPSFRFTNLFRDDKKL